MQESQRIAINELTSDIINILEIDIPINTDIIVKKLHGHISEDTDIKRSFVKKVDNTFGICMCPIKDNIKKNFIVAHELGHLFLDMGYLMDQEYWEKQEIYNCFRRGQLKSEYMANEFALSLLMPRKEYINCINKYEDNGAININKVATYFNVSYEAALNRGKLLGILR